MNKKYTYLILLVLFFGASAFVVIRYNNGLENKINAFYPLLERKGSTALAPDWASTKSRAAELIRQVRDNPDDKKSTLALASLYIKEARVTGNNTYYDAAATRYIDGILQKEPKDFEALTLKALVLLSQHHFAEALVVATEAEKNNPYNAFVYGLMVDGHVEMGDYKAAVAAAEKMISLKPNINSYSRVSYLREIHGDHEGAIEAMNRAVKAGGYGDESTAWARIQLGRLYENAGKMRNAEMHYTIALDQRPGYAHALAGLGRVEMERKDYTKAISYFEKAAAAFNDYSLKENLADLYLASGQKEKAAAAVDAMIKELTEISSGGEEAINHHADKELAYVYLLKGDVGKAEKHALNEYHRRPENIEVNEAVAWVYYKKGAYKEAITYIEAALKTNCQNPTLLCRAGLIYAKANQTRKAKDFLEKGLKDNPNIEIALKEESRKELDHLLQRSI